MRFIKRLFFVTILLVIAFFFYRLINPAGAKALLYDIKSFSNTTIGTHFSLTWAVEESFSPLLDATSDAVVEDTWALQEVTGDDELLLWDASSDENFDTQEQTGTDTAATTCPKMPTVASCPSGQEKYVSFSSPECGTYYACKTVTTTPKTTTTTKTTKTTTNTSSSVDGLSTQDVRDLQNLLKNFQ